VSIVEESDMKDYSQYTNLELVQYLLGDDYEKQLYRGMLAPFFVPEEVLRVNQEKVGAAGELIDRWMDDGLLPAILSTSELIREYLRIRFAAEKSEGFAVLLLNTARELASMEETFRGQVDEGRVSIGAIVRRIVEEGGTAVIFAHHLPLGKAEPGSADIWLATYLKQVLSVLEIEIVDYFLVVGSEPISLAERGLL
jgi:DNA repair protein RadC